MLKLTVEVIKAILTRNTDIGAKMDPYVQLKIVNYVNRTKVLNSKGDMPEWNQSFEFILQSNKGSDTLQIKVKDQDGIKDDIVGQAIIEINSQSLKTMQEAKWYSIKYKNKPAGKVMLKITSTRFQLGYSNQLLNANMANTNQFEKTSSQLKVSRGHKPKGIHLNQNSQIKIKTNNLSQLKRQQNQVFYTGRKGVRQSFSVQKMNTNIGSQINSIQIKQIPLTLHKFILEDRKGLLQGEKGVQFKKYSNLVFKA